MRRLAMIVVTVGASSLYEVYVNGSSEWLLCVAAGYLAVFALIALGRLMRRVRLVETFRNIDPIHLRQWRRFF